MSLRFAMILGATGLVAVLAPACRLERGDYAGTIPAPPDSVRAAVAKGDFVPVAEYARTLPYDTLRGSGDRQRLMVGTRCDPGSKESNCRYGALATIEPWRDAHRIPDTLDLARGRVVARLMTADSAYPKLNLWPGDTTYWWVDRGGEGGDWRAVLVSSNPRRPPVIRDHADWHQSERGSPPPHVWRQSIARFAWSDRDEGLWITCLAWGCCQLDADMF
jgi:hypothetical protein